MGVNSLPKTVTRERRDCDLNPGPTAPESSTPTTRLPSHSIECVYTIVYVIPIDQFRRIICPPKIVPSTGGIGALA